MKKKLKIKSIKPFLTKQEWSKERIKSLKEIGKIKGTSLREDRRYLNAHVWGKNGLKQYKLDKIGYYKTNLSPYYYQKYSEISKQTKKIQKKFQSDTKEKLKLLVDEKNKRWFTDEVVDVLTSQFNVLEVIRESQKSVEDEKKHRKLITEHKYTIYDHIEHKSYKKKDYYLKLKLENYWRKVENLSKALNIPQEEVRNLLAIGGDEFFDGLVEVIEGSPDQIASPEDLKGYWNKIKKYSKRDKQSITQTRAIWKMYGENYFIKRGK